VKNPLTSIRGFAETIAAAPDAPPEEIREFAQAIADSSEQLREIIDEVRDYAKGVRRTYEVAPLSLAAMVRETLSFTKFSRELRLVDLRQELDEKVTVCVNRDKIQQVLLNLLRNAAQAVPASRRGDIHLRVGAADGRGRIEVTDNGSGIPPEAQEKIWENWYSTKGAEGTGLGLGISRKIIEDHGGTLELARSEVGVGSTFVICLPLAAEVAGGNASPVAAMACSGET
jgi:signal transduction histidine kinase